MKIKPGNMIVTRLEGGHDTRSRRKARDKGKSALLDSLVDDFKGVGPSMHVDEVKALTGHNITISCKTKTTYQKEKGRFGFYGMPPNTYFSPKL